MAKLTTAQVIAKVNKNVEASAKRFNAEIQKFSSQLVPEQIVALHKKVAFEALARLIAKTPVDTGRARGNWQVNIDASIDTAKTKGWENALQEGTNVLERLEPFKTVYIVNNVTYIIFLENGWSKQAPKGMVVLTIEELRGMFK